MYYIYIRSNDDSHIYFEYIDVHALANIFNILHFPLSTDALDY